MHQQHSMMGLASRSPHLCCCHSWHHGCYPGHRCSPATPPPLFNTPTTTLSSHVQSSSALPRQSKRLVVSLAHFCSLCCPYLHKLMLSPHPKDTLRGHDCLPLNKKQQREKQREFFIYNPPLHQYFTI